MVMRLITVGHHWAHQHHSSQPPKKVKLSSANVNQ